MASNAENVSIRWRHHVHSWSVTIYYMCTMSEFKNSRKLNSVSLPTISASSSGFGKIPHSTPQRISIIVSLKCQLYKILFKENKIYYMPFPSLFGLDTDHATDWMARQYFNVTRLLGIWDMAPGGYCMTTLLVHIHPNQVTATHFKMGFHIAKTLGSTSIRYRSDTFASDRYLIDIDLRAFGICVIDFQMSCSDITWLIDGVSI